MKFIGAIIILFFIGCNSEATKEKELPQKENEPLSLFLNKPVEKVALSEYGPMFPFLSQVLIFQKYCFAALSFDPLK